MEWTRGNVLGRGSTAAVYTANTRQSDIVFAVKSVELHRSEFLKKEQKILSTLNCPHIVAYQGCDITLENGVQWFNMFIEYAPHGTVAERGGCMEETLVGSYTRQILQGLNYLHSNGIVHCDVKGKNVLVTDQGVKIADLGCARRVEEEYSSVIAGTPAFMAPEVARGEQQGFPADVWALGCTVLEMITGKPPWQGGGDPAAVVYKIGFSDEVPEIPSFVSEQGKDFLGKCLKRDLNERWTVEELLGHVFVKECMEVKVFLDSDTPTCVLEQGFWDTVETTQPLSPDCPSPSDRIRRLFSDEPVWEWDNDEDWVTVRSNEVHHIFCEEQNNLITFSDFNIAVELSRWNVIASDNCYFQCKNCDFLILSIFVYLMSIFNEKLDGNFYHICCFLLSLLIFNDIYSIMSYNNCLI